MFRWENRNPKVRAVYRHTLSLSMLSATAAAREWPTRSRGRFAISLLTINMKKRSVLLNINRCGNQR